MQKESKIYIAGHLGLVGSAILRRLQKQVYHNFVTRSRKELDLLDQKAVLDFFQKEKPEYVFLAAAKVGGIMANSTYRGQFIYENLQIQNNIIHSAFLSGVKKLLFLGSSCIYPKNAPQPLKEDYLLTQELEYTNEPYAIAKIAGIKMCESYNLQYGTDYISVMPTNLYGPNDNFNLETSHVLPAMIRKMHLGKLLKSNNWQTIDKDLNTRPIEGVSGVNTKDEKLAVLEKHGIYQKEDTVVITLWGSGKPMREFLHSDDMAEACLYIMNNVSFSDVTGGKKEVRNTHLNIGSGEDLTIKELADVIQQVVKYDGQLMWDAEKPDGTMRKLMDVSKLEKLGWKYKIKLKEGIFDVYYKYCEQLGQ